MILFFIPLGILFFAICYGIFTMNSDNFFIGFFAAVLAAVIGFLAILVGGYSFLPSQHDEIKTTLKEPTGDLPIVSVINDEGIVFRVLLEDEDNPGVFQTKDLYSASTKLIINDDAEAYLIQKKSKFYCEWYLCRFADGSEYELYVPSDQVSLPGQRGNLE